MSHNFQVTRVNFFCFFSSGKRYRIWDATCSFCQVLNLSWYILMLAKRLALKMYVPVHKLSNYLIKQRFFFCIISCQNIPTLLTFIFYSSAGLWNLLSWWSFWCFLISDKKGNLSGSRSTKNVLVGSANESPLVLSRDHLLGTYFLNHHQVNCICSV